METTQDTLKMTATEKPTPKVMTVADVKPGTLFKLQKSGTHYIKQKDGSFRNVDKALRKNVKQATAALRKLGYSAEEANKAIREFGATAADAMQRQSKEGQTTNDIS